MSKIKVRNAGFERGSVDFWESYVDATLSAYSTDQKYGVYSGKAVYNTTALDGLITADYIDVSEGEVLKIAGYIRPSGVRYGGIRVVEYDGDYSLITTHDVTWHELSALWNYEVGFLNIPADVEYIRIGYVNGALSAGKSLLVDGASVIRIDEAYTQPMGVSVRALAEFNTSFNTSGARVDLMGCRDFYISMDYNYASGAADSIVLNIREGDMILTDTYLVGTHSIGAVNTSETKRIELAGSVGANLYVDCVVTNPASLVAWMGVSLIGVRI